MTPGLNAVSWQERLLLDGLLDGLLHGLLGRRLGDLLDSLLRRGLLAAAELRGTRNTRTTAERMRCQCGQFAAGDGTITTSAELVAATATRIVGGAVVSVNAFVQARTARTRETTRIDICSWRGCQPFAASPGIA